MATLTVDDQAFEVVGDPTWGTSGIALVPFIAARIRIPPGVPASHLDVASGAVRLELPGGRRINGKDLSLVGGLTVHATMTGEMTSVRFEGDVVTDSTD